MSFRRDGEIGVREIFKRMASYLVYILDLIPNEWMGIHIRGGEVGERHRHGTRVKMVVQAGKGSYSEEQDPSTFLHHPSFSSSSSPSSTWRTSVRRFSPLFIHSRLGWDRKSWRTCFSFPPHLLLLIFLSCQTLTDGDTDTHSSHSKKGKCGMRRRRRMETRRYLQTTHGIENQRMDEEEDACLFLFFAA